MKIKNIDGLSVSEIQAIVNDGGRFVFFPYTVSVVLAGTIRKLIQALIIFEVWYRLTRYKETTNRLLIIFQGKR